MADETEEQKPPTREEAVAAIAKAQQNDFDRRDREERIAILRRKSDCGHAGNNPLFRLFNPSIEYTLDELKTLVPLERDRWNYDWVNEKKGTRGAFALNRHGLFSIAKPRGRRHPHMSKIQQAIRSASLRIFRELFAARAEHLKATCEEQNIEYIGMPDAALPEIGQLASRLAMQEVMSKRRLKARKARRRQQHSRKVNAGLLTVSTSDKNYVNKGGEYGR
jgi:hypothetical protein